MKRKDSIFKVFFYSFIAFIHIFEINRPYGYMWSKTIEKIDRYAESSMQKTSNSGDIIAESTSISPVPNQQPKPIDLYIQPKILKLRSKGKLLFFWIRLHEDCDPHAIFFDSLELTIQSCSKCKTIYPTCHFPLHGQYVTVFLRQDLIDILETMNLKLPAKLNLNVDGEMNDGTPFEGIESIWVIK